MYVYECVCVSVTLCTMSPTSSVLCGESESCSFVFKPMLMVGECNATSCVCCCFLQCVKFSSHPQTRAKRFEMQCETAICIYGDVFCDSWVRKSLALLFAPLSSTVSPYSTHRRYTCSNECFLYLQYCPAVLSQSQDSWTLSVPVFVISMLSLSSNNPVICPT